MTRCFICGAKIEDITLIELFDKGYQFAERPADTCRVLFVACPEHSTKTFDKAKKEIAKRNIEIRDSHEIKI